MCVIVVLSAHYLITSAGDLGLDRIANISAYVPATISLVLPLFDTLVQLKASADRYYLSRRLEARY
jgi:hypothetical protein